MRAAAALAGLLALGACISAGGRENLAQPEPVFRPEQFFAGETSGTGTLKVVGRERVTTFVESTGRLQPDGSLKLRQRITEGDKPPRVRTWVVRPLGGGRYTGTLTDAKGPVAGEVSGNRFHVRYKGDGTTVEQWLYLQPDGRTVVNRLEARKFGVTVAALEETIRKGG